MSSGDGDNEDRAIELFDRLKGILKDVYPHDTKVQSNDCLDKTQSETSHVGTDRNNPNEDFCDGVIDGVSLKDIAANHKIILDNTEVSITQKNNITETLDNSIVDDSKLDNHSAPHATTTNSEGLHLGMNELFLLVREYEEVKAKYLRLETNTNSVLPCKKCEQMKEHVDHNSNISLEKINVLHTENERLTTEIELLNVKTKNNESLQNALKNTIERLENDIQDKKKAAAVAIDKLSSHDAAAKRAISVLQKEHEARVEEVNRKYDLSVSEKDAHVIKISKLEANLHQLKQANASQQRKLSDQDAELERVKSLLKIKETDHAKVLSMNEQAEKEIAKLTKRVESHKEEMEGQDIKIKWAQNKLKTELESHKETKKQLSILSNKLKEAKEEGEQIRRNCQEMIERYQGDEEINSVSLRKQLEEEGNNKKELEELCIKQSKEMQEKGDEVNLITEENRKLSVQLNDKKAAVIALEGKNTELTCQLVEKEKDFAEMKTSLETLKEQIKELQQLQATVKRYENEIQGLNMQVEELTSQLSECLNDVKQHKEQESEMLQFSQSLTESDVLSKASLNELQSKLCKTIVEKEENSAKYVMLEKDLLSKMETLTNDKKTLQENIDGLSSQLNQKSVMVNEISSELEETKHELKVTKKKNASQLKDLQRELHQTTKKIELLEGQSNGSIETLSNRSRTSSCNSLEKLQGTDSPVYSTSPSCSSSPQTARKSLVIPQDHYVTQPRRANTSNGPPQELEIDKKMLVERICKLQKLHAKKNEKIEFLEDHNTQLTEALKKKSKIIQHYFLRQEPGLITPDKYDDIKACMSQYGGIMSSVYSAKSTDKAMTLDLSLTINSKLQAVLEDTVLKNITLQESLNTLGIEIAKFQAVSKPP